MRSGFNALTAVGATAFALWGSTAQAVPIRYDCDTAAGSYSMIDFAQAGPNYRITGRVAGVTFRAHSNFFPVANVRLVSPDNKARVGIRITRQGTDGPIEAILQTFSSGVQRDTILGTLRPGEQTPFEIEVADGSVRVNMAGQTMEVAPLIGRNAKIEISCSTGHFMFEELDWDAPAAP